MRGTQSRELLFARTLVLLNSLTTDRSSCLRTVLLLDAGGGGGDGPPCLAGGHAQRHCAARQQRQNNRLYNLVNLIFTHNDSNRG